MPGRPTNLDISKAIVGQVTVVKVGANWGVWFFSLADHTSFYSLSLGEARNRLKYCLKEPLNPR